MWLLRTAEQESNLRAYVANEQESNLRANLVKQDIKSRTLTNDEEKLLAAPTTRYERSMCCTKHALMPPA